MGLGFDAAQSDRSARREFLQRGVAVTAAGAAALFLAGCATGRNTQPLPGRELAELASHDLLNGGADPVPIPCLDRNGSHNQSPGPGQEPSNIYHLNWLKTVPKSQGYWEKGMFAVQHIACRLRNRFTLDKLIQHFGLES